MLPLLLTALLLVENLEDVTSSPAWDDSKAAEPTEVITTLLYMKNNPETLEEVLSQNYPVTEGDMILDYDRNAVNNVWETLDIPFGISPDVVSRTNDINAALKMVSEQTCLTFHKRRSESDYLLFKLSTGCASFVGCVGGEQPVFVGPMCTMGNIAHEIIHSLGFYHEHTRMDRDKYITIKFSNIMSGMEGNFKKYEGETFNLPYDAGSIMHYSRTAFSVNGKDTIEPDTDVKMMGQRVKMTPIDVERIRRLYKCDQVRAQNDKPTVVHNVASAPSVE